MTAGEKIRKRRIELNMTMDDLGKAIGVQRSAVNKYEKDQIDMKASTIAAIAKVLMVSPVYLLDDVEDGETDQARLEALHHAEAGASVSCSTVPGRCPATTWSSCSRWRTGS